MLFGSIIGFIRENFFHSFLFAFYLLAFVSVVGVSGLKKLLIPKITDGLLHFYRKFFFVRFIMEIFLKVEICKFNISILLGNNFSTKLVYSVAKHGRKF